MWNRGNKVVHAPRHYANNKVGDITKEEVVVLLLKTAQMDPNTENADRVASELGFFALTIN